MLASKQAYAAYDAQWQCVHGSCRKSSEAAAVHAACHALSMKCEPLYVQMVLIRRKRRLKVRILEARALYQSENYQHSKMHKKFFYEFVILP